MTHRTEKQKQLKRDRKGLEIYFCLVILMEVWLLYSRIRELVD